jgi:Holliday junction resolvase-like predicted endonuclease
LRGSRSGSVSPSRIGDIAEIKAVVWLLEQGFEVFRNTGATGPADIVIWDVNSGKLVPVDVKNGSKYVKKDGTVSINAGGLGKHSQTGVRYLIYMREDDAFIWHEDV